MSELWAFAKFAATVIMLSSGFARQRRTDPADHNVSFSPFISNIR